jgi:hemolysin type calcium-binding protein
MLCVAALALFLLWMSLGRATAPPVSSSPAAGFVRGTSVEEHVETTGGDSGDELAPHARPACRGRTVTVVGTAGDDVLAGTSGPDVMAGLAGDDRIAGGGGGDLICGGGGADDLAGEEGDDTIDGDGGTDTLIGGVGSDSLDGGPGRDACAVGLGGGHDRGCEAPAFGEAFGVTLFAVADKVVGVGYHESLFSTAQQIHPFGHILRNDDERFLQPPDTEGPDYAVMASRGRTAAPATSADVVVQGHGVPVLSPVTGTVVGVVRYSLYCQALDWELVVRPDWNQGAIVIMLHFSSPTVKAGDRVVASVTRVGTSWGNDSPTAQENRYFPEPYPHLHVEVERGTRIPIAGCPVG